MKIPPSHLVHLVKNSSVTVSGNFHVVAFQHCLLSFFYAPLRVWLCLPSAYTNPLPLYITHSVALIAPVWTVTIPSLCQQLSATGGPSRAWQIFQVCPQECWVKQNNNLPWPPASACACAAHYTTSFCYHKGTLLPHVQLVTHQEPQVLSIGAAVQGVTIQPVPVHEVILCQV